jgi:hypothetical protein
MSIHTALQMSPKRRYSFWINEAEAEGLKLVKAEEGIAESEQIRQAVRDWLRKKGVTKTDRKRVHPRKRP